MMAKISDTNPKKQMAGANFILLKLKMSGSNCVSVEPGPPIRMNPSIMATTLAMSSI
jgi:hypothetical protein